MVDLYTDQAEGLRRLFAREQLRVIAFAAGSAGVGKSTLVANLAVCLAQQGRNVLVFDEGTKGGVAACFGAEVRHDLLQVVEGRVPLSEALVQVFQGVRVVPVSGAVKRLGKLDSAQRSTLVQSFLALDDPADVILVDASLEHPLGFSPFGLAAHQTVIVMSPTPASITEAYALIKKASLGYARRDYRILVNGARNAVEARAVFSNIARVTHSRRFARLEYAGGVPLDERLHRAAALCQPVASLYPEAAAAKACRTLAGELLGWQLPEQHAVGLEQFFEQLLHLSQQIDPVAIYA